MASVQQFNGSFRVYWWETKDGVHRQRSLTLGPFSTVEGAITGTQHLIADTEGEIAKLEAMVHRLPYFYVHKYDLHRAQERLEKLRGRLAKLTDYQSKHPSLVVGASAEASGSGAG
jgi:hypothetical protein